MLRVNARSSSIRPFALMSYGFDQREFFATAATHIAP